MYYLLLYWSCAAWQQSNDLETNIDIFGSEDFDDRIHRAYSESLSKHSVLPILKQELQCKIQCNRLARGEAELVLEEEERPKTYELSEAEKTKRNVRLEQNRRSAFRSRQNAKERESRLMKKIDDLYADNKKLTKELKELKEEKKMIFARLEAHVGSCENKTAKYDLAFQLTLHHK